MSIGYVYSVVWRGDIKKKEVAALINASIVRKANMKAKKEPASINGFADVAE
jgi:hypothetical protein